MLVSIKLVTPFQLSRGDLELALSGLLDPACDGSCSKPFYMIRIASLDWPFSTHDRAGSEQRSKRLVKTRRNRALKIRIKH